MSDTPGAGAQAAASSRPPTRPIGRRRRRLRATVAVLAVVAVLAGAGGFGYYWSTRPQVHRPGEDLAQITTRLVRDLPESAPPIDFADVTADAGLGAFRSFAGARTSQLPEDMGSGAAWGDFDGDGDDDLFLVASGGPVDAALADRAACSLYENRGDGTFRRVAAFPQTRIIGMGAAWGDYTGDGRLDLVVTGYDSLLLFRNTPGGFVRDKSFPSPPGFWAGASWGDFNNDRRPDLYVCGYVQYTSADADLARATQQYGTVVPYTLNPSSYPPQRNLLFVNDGDGSFREVAEELGVANVAGRSLGALWHDFDQDGRLDLYVANDVSDNVLYRNLGGRFVEISHAAWVADYRGAMGLAQGDYDRDGDDEIFVTHWVAQENALYDSLLMDLTARGAAAGDPPGDTGGDVPGTLRFMDIADMRGLGQIALQAVGWGTEFTDFDADGWLDLVVANGSTFEAAGEPKRLKPQRSFLFWNRRGEHFHDLAGTSPVFSTGHVSRGLAVSDYDQDGDQDILFVHHGEGVQLLRNDMQRGNWLQVRLRSRNPDGSPTGFGDGATVVAHAGPVALRRAVTGASYLSQSSRTLHFGLGPARTIDRLEVHWLGGERETWTGLHANALWELTEGDPEPRLIRAGSTASTAAAPLTDRRRVARFWLKQRAAMRAVKVSGDLPAAIGLFREALALDPAHEDARYYLANCLAATGDAAGAAGELETLLAGNPRSHRALKRLGLLEAADVSSPGRLKRAMTLLERALAINPEETGVLLAMGEIDLVLGDHEQARQRLEWACRTNPRAVSGFFLRGYLAWKHGDPDRARQLLAQAAAARGESFKPQGTTAEGDVGRRMHDEPSPLSAYWNQWDGEADPDAAFAALAALLDAPRAGS